VLDQSIQWTQIFFMLPFGILFPLVGIGAAYVFLKTLMLPITGFGSTQKASPRVPNANTLRPEGKGLAMLVGSVVLAVFSSPFVAGAWFGDAPWVFKPVSALLLLGVLALFVNGIRSVFAHRSSVAPTLSLHPALPRLGGRTQVRVQLPGTIQSPTLSLILCCTETDARGSTSVTRVPTRISFLVSRVAASRTHATEYEGWVDVPALSHASVSVPGGQSYAWTIELEKSVQRASYTVPVTIAPALPGSAMMPSHTERTSARSATLGATAPVFEVPSSIATMATVGRAWTITFTAPGLHAGPVFLLILALSCFAWIGWDIMHAQASAYRDWPQYAVVFVIGAVGVWYAMHFATRVVRTTISPAGLVRTRASVLHTAHHKIPLAHIRGIGVAKRFESNAEVFQSLTVSCSVGGPEPLTPAIKHLGALNAILAHMHRALADVQAYGITPKPLSPVVAIYPMPRRVAAMALFCGLLVAFAAVGFTLARDRNAALEAEQARSNAVTQQRRDFVPEDRARFQPLMTALDNRDSAALERLLDNGADPNTTRWDGHSLLMRAAYAGDLAMVNTLLRHKADPNLAIAPSFSRAGVTALSDALYTKNLDIARALLNAGARVDGAACCGWTLMHVVAQGDCTACMELLLSRGVPVDASATASRGETPLMVAARYGQLTTIRWLILHGADKNKRDPYGYNPSGWAAFFKQTAAQKLLITLGADPDTDAKK
jgi:hypothetical protein